MLFQTWDFAVLFAAVLLAMLLLRRAAGQQVFLLATSYVFYGWWDVRFLLLILLSSMIDYAAALGIRGVRLSWRRRLEMSALMLTATALFLGIDWPALQGGRGGAAALFPPSWPGYREAIGMAIAFSLVGPLLYELTFRLDQAARARAFVTTSVVANLGILGFFKYFDFFRDNLRGLSAALGFDVPIPAIDVALPVGISFYTFQTMSYTIDVYRGHVAPERSLRRMALYVAYFPQLVAGPILRPSQFLPALGHAWTLRSASLRSGFHLILVGLVKKVLIADRVGPLADLILGDPSGVPSLLIVYGAALFAVQIYCDFSGYTDIARGLSRMLGIEIPLNFDFPYFSRSITEFWRRWHISLSTWLRDYLYIPLGGNRAGVGRTYFNLMATMVLGGLWHGASWNFVIWGAYQGALLCANRALSGWIAARPGPSRLLARPLAQLACWAFTLYLTLLGWLIFRISDPGDLMTAVRAYLVFDGRLEIASMGLGTAAPFSATLAFALFWVLHAIGRGWRRWPDALDTAPRSVQLCLYVLLGAAFFFLWPAASPPFIYFQF